MIDPIGLAGGLNNTQYVPNPTGWVDNEGISTTLITQRTELIPPCLLPIEGDAGIYKQTVELIMRYVIFESLFLPHLVSQKLIKYGGFAVQ